MAQAARLTGYGAAALAGSALLGAVPAAGTDWTVRTFAAAFDPATLTVAAGDTVTWVDATPARHEVRFAGDPEGGPADRVRPWFSRMPYTLTARVPGRYDYHCAIHGMYGTLVVAPVAGAAR